MEYSDKERSDHDQQISIEKFKVLGTTGLRVLVVDDDSACLRIAGNMLNACKYEVTACKTAREALSILREDKNRFDMVLTDLHMPDMNGVSLLESIGILGMDLPVVIMSHSDTEEDIIEGITHGARDYLVKPITMGAIKLLWKNVITRKVRNSTAKPANYDGGEIVLEGSNSKESLVVPNDQISKEKTSMKRKIGDENLDAGGKKKRFVWSQELHQKFLEAVGELGSYSTAVPKKILEVMKRMEVPNITRENIASHLQKYRSSIRKKRKEKSFMETPLQSILSVDMLNIRSSRQSNLNPLINLQNNNYHPGSTSSQPAPMQHRLSNLCLPNSNILANNRFGSGSTAIHVSGTGTGMSSVDLTTSNYNLNENIGFSNEPIIQRSDSIEGIFGRNGNPMPLRVDYSGVQYSDQVDQLLEKNYMPESPYLFPVTENMPGIMRTSSGEDFYNMLAFYQQQGHDKDAGLSFDTLLT